ncbi:MAG: hypothetical protein K9I85_14170 [Saprospiraceae bacterium]|nr:hypothetical protein [Saprospiraceae bacterium]
MNTSISAPCAGRSFVSPIGSSKPYLHSAIIGAFLLVFSLSTASAQVGFIAESVVASPGSVLHLPIKVTEFDSISGFQLSIEWDTLVLQFDSISNFDLEKIENFDWALDSIHRMSMFWYADDVYSGFSTENGHTIFTLSFTVIGQMGDSSWVSFVDEPLTPEVIDYNDNPVPIDFTYGLVQVQENSAVVPAFIPPLKMQIIPNPCREWCDVQLEVSQATDVIVQVVNLAGAVVYELESHLLPGHQDISIPAAEALHSGGYYVIVITEQGRYIKRMLIQK